MELTRRSFVRNATLGTVGSAALVGSAAAYAKDGTAESTAKDDGAREGVVAEGAKGADETVEADVVVIGAGPGGISCATRLAELGAKVALVEKTDVIGGTGLYASGNCYISLNSEYQTSQGLVADIPAFYKEWLEAVHYHCDHEVLGTYLRTCGRVVDWLRGYGFEFYLKDVPATNGLSGNEYRISQPPRDSGVREAAYGAMIDVVTAAGGMVSFNTTAQELIVDADNRVKGARCVRSDGTTADFIGRAVVIGTGGYAANREMVDELCKVPLLGRDPVQNNGECAKAAWAAGARKPWNLGILCCDTLYPIDADYNSTMGGVQMLGNVMNDLGKSQLHVNPQGRRFHSEDAFCWVPTYGGTNAIEYDQPYLYVICGQATIDAAMAMEKSTLDQAALDAAIEAGIAYTGATVTELAEAAGMSADVLETTVKEYNEACAKGEDATFYKDAAYLVPIEEGPFYAIRMAPTPFGTCGDVSVDARCRVRAEEGDDVVPGLYAVGTECVGVMHNDYYWALGQTVGWAHTSGVLSAEDIAGNVLGLAVR
ncbi:FAD-dependent oxidoreductase [bacterium]|nr:FAD-dependent oxidoreductase [bacterium]